MKRIVSLIVVLCLLLSATCFAEDFTLHSGTTFGMTVDEVMEAERKQGFEPKVIERKNSFAPEGIKRVSVHPELLAGQEDGEVVFFFDDDRLTSCFYSFSWYEVKGLLALDWSIPADAYESLLAKLKEKYGAALTGGDKYIDFGTAAYDAYDWYPHYKQFMGCTEIEIMDSCQWLVEADDKLVQIVIMYEKCYISNIGTYMGDVIISYNIVSADEYEKVMEEAEKKTQSANDDL